ncbi:hypothetical protein ACH5RR_021511 [Cinchona calisaya]|uniref:Uncharacterized protein n=1 Tax=Cinchona calisaya TaxID=153742 RepID=A0ABD2ZHI9_9GENT
MMGCFEQPITMEVVEEDFGRGGYTMAVWCLFLFLKYCDFDFPLIIMLYVEYISCFFWQLTTVNVENEQFGHGGFTIADQFFTLHFMHETLNFYGPNDIVKHADLSLLKINEI